MGDRSRERSGLLVHQQCQVSFEMYFINYYHCFDWFRVSHMLHTSPPPCPLVGKVTVPSLCNTGVAGKQGTPDGREKWEAIHSQGWC